MAFDIKDISGLGSLADLAKSLVDRWLPPAATDQEKMAAQVQLQQMLEARENAVLDVQKSVMVAELSQDDRFTKRARPMVIYFGLVAIGLVHVVLPIIAWIWLVATNKPLASMPSITLPEDFWWAWGGVVGLYVLGRTGERMGVGGKLIGAITGSGAKSNG